MSTTPIIYGISASRTSRCLWLLEELAVPYQHVPVSYMNKGAHTPDMLALNPNGHIPVMVDGDLKVWESMAINLYLCKKYQSDLGAQNLTEEAALLQWSFWVITEVEKDALAVLFHGMVLPEAQRKPELFSQASSALRKPLAVLNAHLENNNFAIGDRFSVLDINLASIINWIRPAPDLLNDHPHVQRWLQESIARPAFKKVRSLP